MLQEGSRRIGVIRDSLNRIYQQSFGSISNLIVLLVWLQKNKHPIKSRGLKKDFWALQKSQFTEWAGAEIQYRARKWSAQSFGIIIFTENYIFESNICDCNQVSIYGEFPHFQCFSTTANGSETKSLEALVVVIWGTRHCNGRKRARTRVSFMDDETGMMAKEDVLPQLAHSVKSEYTAKHVPAYDIKRNKNMYSHILWVWHHNSVRKLLLSMIKLPMCYTSAFQRRYISVLFLIFL